MFSAWPNSGAGLDTGDHRGAVRVVVQVDAHASIDVQASLEVRPHAPADGCEVVGSPMVACRSAREVNCRPGRVTAQGLDLPKKLLR